MNFSETTSFSSPPTYPSFEHPSRTAWKPILITLVALTILAFGFRVVDLDAAGFAEDEVHKVQAVEAYRRGEFKENLEHPMLMKLAMTASTVAAETWNELAPNARIAPETALRLPNALLGALTTLVLGLLAVELFSPAVGIIAAALWATGILAISTNRIGKEDTFLVFFLWTAYYTYLHAKRLGMKGELTPGERRRQAWWYTASGASFGLMMASKYFPHYWGLLFLWEYVDHKLRPTNPLTNPIPKFVFPRYYGLMIAFFLLANPIIASPSTVQYMIDYMGEETVTHHGYVLMDVLFYNNPSRTAFSGGLPLFFYGLMLAVKTQPTVLLGLIVGLVVTATRIRRSQYFFIVFMFAFWIVPFSIIGAKWMRYTLSLLPMVCIVAAVGIWFLVESTCRLLRRSDQAEGPGGAPENWLAVGLCCAFLIPAGIAAAKHAPFYGLYVNTLGGGETRAGHYFPHDEFYDAGVREALNYVARTAPSGSTVVCETPEVARYYLGRYRRTDLTEAMLSDRDFDLWSPGRKYVIVQKGRRYFENADRIDRLAETMSPSYEVRVAGQVAARVYVVEDQNDERDRYIVQGSGFERRGSGFGVQGSGLRKTGN